MGQWSKKKKKESAKEVSLFFTNDLIRKGLRRSSPTYFPEALQPFNCQLCMSIKLVASKSRKLEGQMKSKNMDFLDKKRIQIDGISHKDETCNALGWIKKIVCSSPAPFHVLLRILWHLEQSVFSVSDSLFLIVLLHLWPRYLMALLLLLKK